MYNTHCLILAEMRVVSEAVSVSVIRNKYQTNHHVVQIPTPDLVSVSSSYVAPITKAIESTPS